MRMQEDKLVKVHSRIDGLSIRRNPPKWQACQTHFILLSSLIYRPATEYGMNAVVLVVSTKLTSRRSEVQDKSPIYPSASLSAFRDTDRFLRPYPIVQISPVYTD